VYKIIFYRDKNGNEPVLEYIRTLADKNNKDSRIKLNKINDYIQALAVYGISAGEPYVKHLRDEIWELRPIRERVLFAAWIEGGFVLLHHFTKKTRKTPNKEIEQAERNLTDFKERSGNDENNNKK
jgi:phage-related protein